jgi:hypothetical protein
MSEGSATRKDSLLLPLILIYGAASLAHHMHNAIYLHDYPNLPVWLTAAGVVAAWLAVAAVGAVGYLLYRRVSRAVGLMTISAYAVLGFAGLDHYTVAPMSAHTLVMNLTILLEVVTSAVLLVCVARSAFALRVQRSQA